MAEAMTYDSLLADIQTYAERDDVPFVTQIPRFVMLAENRLALEIKALGFLRVANTALVVGTSIYEKPARWRETKSMSIIDTNGNRVYMKPRGFEYCAMFGTEVGSTGFPLYYSDMDYEHFYIARTPDEAYTSQVSYYERPEPLSEENQTNWTTQYAPQLLLYATLLEAQPFLKRPERTQEFQAMYDRVAGAIMQEDNVKNTDNSVVRSNA